MYALIPKMTQPVNVIASPPKLLSSITQDKSKTVIAQYWIATQPILLANSPKFNQRTIEEQVKLLKRNQNSLNLVMLP